MGSFNEDIRNKLDRLRSIIKSEKNSTYTNSIELAKHIFCRIVSNSTNPGDTNALYLEELLQLSIIIKDYPKRIIIKGTSKQQGIKFDASIMCLLNRNDIKFIDVNIIPFMCVPNTDGTKSYIQISFLRQAEPPSKSNYWNLKNMRYRTTDSTRSNKRSTFDKSIIVFKFNAKLEHSLAYKLPSISVELLSETVVVIVHSNQEVDSLLTLFWDDYYRCNRFSSSDQLDFRCHDMSRFQTLVENLSDYFYHETGRHLTENNKTNLIQRMHILFPSQEYITFENFVKQIMQSSKFSFGQWIMCIIKMLKIQSLEKMWQNNLIEGFISKDGDGIFFPPHSFILRFSERQAAIGVLYKTPKNTIDPWDPFIDTHLRSNNLANLLNGYNYCLHHLTDTLGNTYPIREVLEPFMDKEYIDDGYTDRGGPNDYQSPNQDFVETVNDYEFNNIGDLDLNELWNNCEILINECNEKH